MNKLYIPFLVLIIGADVFAAQWSGTSIFDVTNQDLYLIGECQFTASETVNVTADSANITIYINVDSIVRSSPEGTGNTLYLNAEDGYTITVQVNRHLCFEGAPTVLDQPLQIIETGSGAVVWSIDPDHGKLEFTAAHNSGGTQLLIQFDGESAPQHSFIVTKHNQIYFGPRSAWGYLLTDSCNDNDNAETIVEKSNTHDRNTTYLGFEDFSSFALYITSEC